MAVTCTHVPNGRLRCAATRSRREVRPLEDPRYQDAMPTWLHGAAVRFGAGLDAGAVACWGGRPAQLVSARSGTNHVKLARMILIQTRFAGPDHRPSVTLSKPHLGQR